MKPKKERSKSKDKSLAGFTLMELLVVIAIIGVLFVPFVITYNSSRNTQALYASGQRFADQIRTAHVFAREANSQKEWGIVRDDETSYSLVSGSKDSWSVVSNHQLETKVYFVDDFFVWFKILTGEADDEHSILLQNENGNQVRVRVFETGVVETETL
jgi:prepilin-type N-terminal cleavage/methylation domain-containing protein